jgi:hypothetical protein
MILPYLARLLCLSLACFFLVHLALGLGVSLLAPSVLAVAKRVRPSSAAGLLLAARLFPSVASVMVVAGICVPSYLWLEPDAPVEEVGLICFALALLGVASWGVSLGRGLRAIVLSIRYGRYCKKVGAQILLAGERVSVVDGAGGLLALAGIVHPRLVISREVARELSPDQLVVAFRHEVAHRTSRDNLKRLLMLIVPEVLPFRFRLVAGLAMLERGWARFTEWAADDLAVRGDSRRSVSLAGALVRVARMGVAAEASPLMTSLVADPGDLEARVDRLLGAAPGAENPAHWRPVFMAPILLVAGFLVVAFTGPATFEATHWLLEQLIR